MKNPTLEFSDLDGHKATLQLIGRAPEHQPYFHLEGDDCFVSAHGAPLKAFIAKCVARLYPGGQIVQPKKKTGSNR